MPRNWEKKSYINIDSTLSKDLSVKIVLSDLAPEANKVSGKFKHIYKDYD